MGKKERLFSMGNGDPAKCTAPNGKKSCVPRMKDKDKTDTPPPPPKKVAGLNMNVRDISNNPGDVMPSKISSKESYTRDQIAQAKVSEKEATKEREELARQKVKATKKMKTPQEIKIKKKVSF